jgi:type IX secretion system PorP/SprF family membrane protein
MKYIVKTVKKGIFLILLLNLQQSIKAQLTPIYSQYMLNGFILNPALAGADGCEILNLISRQQWVGYDDYPRTNWISFQTRIIKRKYLIKNFLGKKKLKPKTTGKVGIGGYLYNDRTGFINRNGGQFSYAYHINLDNKNTQLSLGLAARFYQLTFNRSLIVLANQNDVYLNSVTSKNYFIPNFSAGANLLGNSYYVGVSAAELLQSKLMINGQYLNGYTNPMVFYVQAGYLFNLSPKYVLEPSVLEVLEQDNSLTTFTLKVTYNSNFWMGVSFRTNMDVVYIVGFKYSYYYFSYAFDYPLTSLSTQNFGTHEISIALKFGSTERRSRWEERY